MTHPVMRPSAAALIVSLAMCLGSGPAAGRFGYGETVDNYCSTYDGSTPFQALGGSTGNGGCLLCHTSTSGSGVRGSTWTWWQNGQYDLFCTGTPPNRAPNGTITSPTANQQITVGSAVTFLGSGTDPDGDALSFNWDFGISNATGPGPHTVTYSAIGTYTATLTVSDGTLDDPTPAIRLVTVRTMQNCTDADGDGFFVGDTSCGPVDCNDADPTVNPNAAEICGDGIDNNCDARIDTADPLAVGCTACLDSDDDSYSPEGGICGPVDCDDTNPSINPGAREICDDGVDNDCDFYLDATDTECSGEDCLGRLLPVIDLSPRVGWDPYREPAELLDGLTVFGTLFVFVPAEPGILQVRFYLDGDLYRTATEVPWDLVGGAASGAGPFNSRTLSNGWHGIRVEADLAGARTDSANASFLVQNLQPNQAPTCMIAAPVANRAIAPGENVTFAGTGMDSDGDLPLAYAWDFGGGAPAANLRDPGAVTFAEAGTFLIRFQVSDSAGLACLDPATVTVTVTEPPGEESFTAHPISTYYVQESHKADWERRPAFCRSCHGANLSGTAASATFGARVWPSDRRQPDGSRLKRYDKGDQVGCLECHEMPEDHGD